MIFICRLVGWYDPRAEDEVALVAPASKPTAALSLNPTERRALTDQARAALVKTRRRFTSAQLAVELLLLSKDSRMLTHQGHLPMLRLQTRRSRIPRSQRKFTHMQGPPALLLAVPRAHQVQAVHEQKIELRFLGTSDRAEQSRNVKDVAGKREDTDRENQP